MANHESQTPDLASVLRILASISSSQRSVDQQFRPYDSHLSSQSTPNTVQPNGSTTPDYEPPPAQAHSSYHEQPNPQAWDQRPVYAQQVSRPPQQQSVVDSSTIIEWSAGLRCIMKTVAKNENIVQEIRRMMKVQHEHEEQWWNGRKALIEKQEARKEGKKKLDEVLKAVGGTVGLGASTDGPEALVRELETFDMKVYKAQMQMVREMNLRLRILGVPFFGTRTDLVRPVGKETPPGSEVQKGMIDEVELVKLQRKILAMLEDMSGD